MIPAIHLPPAGSLGSTDKRANPLNGSGRSFRKTRDPRELRAIAAFLDVERSARYQPANGQTFCNIYAYDFCYLAGVYLPRVWWNGTAIAEMKQRTVVAKYGVTIGELNANALHMWLQNFGFEFGWKPAAHTTVLQQQANDGAVCVITALRADRSRSGHIAAVLPEGPETAIATSGRCEVPVQSQAGVRNFCASTKPGRWWESVQFSAHGLWVNANLPEFQKV